MAIFRKKFQRKPRANRKMAVKKTNKLFAKKVLSVIHKQAEDKQLYYTTGSSPLFFPGGFTALNNISLVMPTCSRGTNEGDRIGNTIRAKSLSINGALFYKQGTVPNSASGARIAIRMMLIQPKNFGSITNIDLANPSWSSQLLQKGNTTSTFSGTTLADLWAPINRQAVTVYYDKVHYLSTTSVNQVSAVGYYSIEPRNSTKFFKISLNLRNKAIKYDDNVGSGITPVSFNPVLVTCWCYMDGSSSVYNTTDVGISLDSTLTFEDM